MALMSAAVATTAFQGFWPTLPPVSGGSRVRGCSGPVEVPSERKGAPTSESRCDSFCSYGELASDRLMVTNLRLPGQYHERGSSPTDAGLLASVGLQGPYYNWNRWYLPSMGRYMELDPIALQGGFNGPFGPNWYGYAEGNPLRLTDVSGLAAWICQAPLHALSGTNRPPAQRKSWFGGGKWNPLYHQYLCSDANGPRRCGGFDRDPGNPFNAPGRRSSDSFIGARCDELQATECEDACIADSIDGPRPSTYSLDTFNCQSWVSITVDYCRTTCQLKEKAKACTVKPDLSVVCK